MTKAQIRSAGPDDASAMARVARAAYALYEPRIGKMPGPALDDYDQRVDEDGTYVLEYENDVVGILVIEAHGETALIDNVAVHPDAQGKRFGIQLLRFAEAEIVRRGYPEAHLYTNAAMPENIAWYELQGYHQTRHVTEKGYNRVYMMKHLVEQA